MSGEELAALFHEQAVATYQDFVTQVESKPYGNSQDLRSGLLAALAIYHFREQLSEPLELSTEAVVLRCPDYALVRDVADIAKHRKLDRASAKLRGPESLQELVVVTLYRDEVGEYRHAEKRVELRLPNGETRSLADILMTVLAFWKDHLRKHGIPVLPIELGNPTAEEPRPRSKCSDVSVSVIPGLRATLAYKIQRFNYDTGEIEPVDLSGRELHYRIFEPTYTVDVVLRDKRTGRRNHARIVVLNPDQAKAFDELETDGARQEFLANTWQVKDAYARLIEESRTSEPESGAKP